MLLRDGPSWCGPGVLTAGRSWWRMVPASKQGSGVLAPPEPWALGNLGLPQQPSPDEEDPRGQTDMSVSTCTAAVGDRSHERRRRGARDGAKIDNDPVALAVAIGKAGPDPEVALEACTGGCATRRHMTGWGVRTHLRPVAAGR